MRIRHLGPLESLISMYKSLRVSRVLLKLAVEEVHLISLGAGVQSSTMALMASAGEITPMPDAAIFADTQHEPQFVYDWLDYLTPRLPFPVVRVSKGSLAATTLRPRVSKKGNRYTSSAIPAFLHPTGMLPRQCTRDFKIRPIISAIRRLWRDCHVVQWIGISRDEAHRMKPSRVPWITHRWPLVDLNIRRSDCLAWMRRHGHPDPPRSACVFCPYHSDAEWKHLRDDEPTAFAEAVEFERRYQETMREGRAMRTIPFLHRSLIPLAQVNFTGDERQTSLWGNECEGMCGV